MNPIYKTVASLSLLSLGGLGYAKVLDLIDHSAAAHKPLDRQKGFPPELAAMADKDGIISVPDIARWLDENGDRKRTDEELQRGRDLLWSMNQSMNLSTNFGNAAHTRRNLARAIKLAEQQIKIDRELNP